MVAAQASKRASAWDRAWDKQHYLGWVMERVNLGNRDRWFQLAREARFRSPALASLLRVSPRQLHRYIRRLFHRSPQAWLDERRLKLAAELLRRCCCVKAVSYELGFKQVSHFSREFKRRYGMPPGRFAARSGDRRTRARPAPPPGSRVVDSTLFI
jgi:AraC-like DNA-binding protein